MLSLELFLTIDSSVSVDWHPSLLLYRMCLRPSSPPVTKMHSLMNKLHVLPYACALLLVVAGAYPSPWQWCTTWALRLHPLHVRLHPLHHIVATPTLTEQKQTEWIRQVSMEGEARSLFLEVLQRNIQRENSEITFWEHRLTTQQETGIV